MGSLLTAKLDETGSYDDFITKKPRRLSRNDYICLLITITIIGIFMKILIENRQIIDYNRKSDPQLLQYVYVSPKAEALPRRGQLFCWVQTAKMYHSTRAQAVNETWLKRCDHGQFFTSDFFSEPDIPYSTVFAGIPESYYNLFYKSRYAFHYIWKYISKDFDWYMKADDDTYVIIEHLKEYLSSLDPNKPYYLGYILRPYLKNGYNAGGAGYVLSREALRQYNEFLYHNESLCPDDIYEDVGIGRCLSSLGIYPHDTRNNKNQNRFNTYHPTEVFYGSKNNPKYTWFPEEKGYAAFASDMISFHHLKPDEIRLFDILLYQTNRR
ncbi:unnamed protein product [Auanema sp. JU1783]|nr:unnamed protein product [Auanema sp. JU1783]